VAATAVAAELMHKARVAINVAKESIKHLVISPTHGGFRGDVGYN
jgi:hypothetical protein